LGIGTANQVLKVNSGATAPEWAVDPTTDVVTTAGDLIYGTGADAVTRLGIGTAGQVLKVNSGATAPEWGAAGGGGMTLLASGTLSGASLDLTSISQSYTDLQLQVFNANWATADDYLILRFNNLSTGIYWSISQGTADGGGTALFYGAGSATRLLLYPNTNWTRTGSNNINITIPDYTATQRRTVFGCYSTAVSGNQALAYFQGFSSNTGALDRITLSTNSAYSFSSGEYKLWGVK
jgi:hypothetical protein